MLNRNTGICLAAACLLAGGAVAQTSTSGAASAAGSTVQTTQPVHTQSMQRLREAADRLRQSI